MEHPLRSHDALLKVMVNADFERMDLLGLSEKGLGILLMQLVVERVNLRPEALIEPLTLPPFCFRLSLGCHDLAPSSTDSHGQAGGQSIIDYTALRFQGDLYSGPRLWSNFWVVIVEWWAYGGWHQRKP
jgi:hypothetical protein